MKKTEDQRDVFIRVAIDSDFDAIWPIFQDIVKRGETYAFDPDLTKEQAFVLWMRQPEVCCVAEYNDRIVGTYYLKPNMAGPGSHVCNCGYMVAAPARGKGVAALMCQHSQQLAVQRGYKAMQFNSVVSSNEQAVRLWQRLGFDIVGRLPKAFSHPQLGLVDSYVMYRWLL